ncbi:MAG: VOC family protein, partial [Stenotrophomonas maltophilia]
YREENAEYADLEGAPAGLNVEVQRVQHASRVHLDIESDDIDAEAARLEALGARRIGFVKRWWVMEAPTGHRFCIVRMREEDGRAPANHWD